MSEPAHRRRNVLLLWSAQFVSASGDALFLPCLVWLAGSTGERDARVGLAVFLAFLPYLLFGPVAGAWVDRAPRRAVMVASDLLRAALLAGLPLLAAVWGGLDFALVVGVGFLLAAFSTPFMPARDALLPTLVGRESLARWNAVMQTSGQLALIAGLGLGGLLLHGSGDEEQDVARVVRVLQIDGATFVVSAILLALLVLPARGPRRVHETHLLRDVREGLAYAVRDRTVGGLLLLTALDNLAIMGPAIVGAAALVRGDLGLGPDAYAWFEGAMAAGMLLGSATLALGARRLSMRGVMLWGMVLDGLTYVPFLWLPSYGACLAAIVLHGVFIPWLVVGRTTIVQRHVPEARHGKVFALVHLTVIGMTACSAALSGWIAGVFGARSLFGVAGVFGTLAGVAGLLAWRVGDGPAGPDGARRDAPAA